MSKKHKNNNKYEKSLRTSPLNSYKTTSPRYKTFDQIRRGCTSKTRFHRRKTVKAAAKQNNLNYYKCPFCGEWHLTKSKGAINPWSEDTGSQSITL